MSLLRYLEGPTARRARDVGKRVTVRLANRAARWAFEEARRRVERRLRVGLSEARGAQGEMTLAAPPGVDLGMVLRAIEEEMRTVAQEERAPAAHAEMRS